MVRNVMGGLLSVKQLKRLQKEIEVTARDTRFYKIPYILEKAFRE